MITNLAALSKSLPVWLVLGGGMALGWVKSFWNNVYDHSVGFLVRKIHVSVTVEETETPEAYNWLNLWAECRIRAKKITDLRLQLVESHDDDRATQAYRAIPHYGTYFLTFKKRYLLVFTSMKEGNATPGADKMSIFKPQRTVKVAIWGTRDRKVIDELLEEARTEFEETLEKRLALYYSDGPWWGKRLISTRPFETVYLPSDTVTSMIEVSEQFLQSRDQYRLLGIPWRIGFLLYGPPGTGKSSVIQALAAHLGLPLYYLNISGVNSPEHLQRLFNSVPNKAILLIEDVDSLPAAREREKKKDGDATEGSPKEKQERGLIAADLFNVIDGVVATEGRILILTTNHRHKLDAALVRRGRIDREFHITWAQDEELRRFHANASKVFPLPPFQEFRRQLPAQTTIADAQALLFGPSHPLIEELAYA